MVTVIKGPLGLIAGIDRQHMIMQYTTAPLLAKRFKTRKAAENYIKKWDGTGVGSPSLPEVLFIDWEH